MKKIISVALSLVLSLGFSACGNKAADITPTLKGIEFNTEITYYNEYYEADVRVETSGDTEIKINFPEEIKGLTVGFENGKGAAEYSGLKYGNGNKLSHTVCGLLHGILKDAENKNPILKNDRYYMEGKVSDIEYTLYLGGSGLPLSVDSNNGFSAIFKDIRIIE